VKTAWRKIHLKSGTEGVLTLTKGDTGQKEGKVEIRGKRISDTKGK